MNENESEQEEKDKRASRGSSNDAKSRNWRFLFDNLKRAVGYIYSMCEQDGDIEECKEAIMVLHNRIKEFEGLIQYIEVQASYETSEERPSSVAWEVPVSAIKQPSLPFQPNGDPQLYYYQCLPQAYTQYSMTGSYPMMDPNLVNYMPYNQQYTGYQADYTSGTTPPQMHQYQQYSNYTDFSNIKSSGSKSSKKGYSKSRRSGSKHDHYKSQTAENYPIPPPSQNLNALDISVHLHSDKPIPDSDGIPNQISPAALNQIENSIGQPESIEVNHDSLVKHDPETRNGNDEPNDSVATDNQVQSLNDGENTTAIDREIADAIDDHSSLDDDSTSVKKGDWTVVSNESNNYVHVSENLSDHSIPTSPNSKDGKEDDNHSTLPEVKSEDSIINVVVVEEDESLSNDVKEEGCAGEYIEKRHPHMKSGPENAPDQAIIPPAENAASIASDEVKCEPISSEIRSECENQKLCDDSQDESSKAISAPDAKDHDFDHQETDADGSNEKSVAETSDFKSDAAISEVKAEEGKCHEMVPVEKSDIEDDSHASTSETGKQAAGSATAGAEEEKPDASMSEMTDKSGGDSTISEPSNQQTKKSDDQATPVKSVKLSCSSEITDPETKEVDLMSESGLSTVSSGSVQSCMSLPTNPLARSTSWADLVRKGKSDSPVPRLPPKLASSAKYQSTPSRYLSHRQTDAKNTKTSGQLALTKSKSVPSQRLLTKAPQSKKSTAPKPKEPHINEDGWCVSSGKGRFKTIAGNSSKSALASTKSGDEKTATDNSNDESTTGKSKTTEPKAKTSEAGDKTKAPRSVRSKSTVSSKTIGGKVVVRSCTTSVPSKTSPKMSTSKSNVGNEACPKVNTGIRSHVTSRNNSLSRATRMVSAKVDTGISKNFTAKPLTKTKSLESPTKLSDNLKNDSSQMTKKAKSLDPLEKSIANRECVESEIIDHPTEEMDSSKSDDIAKEVNEVTNDIIQEFSQTDMASVTAPDTMTSHETDFITNTADVTDVTTEISENIDDIQTPDTKEPVSAPTSLALVSKHEEEDTFNVGRAMMSKRNRQQSEHSSVSTDTLEDEPDVRCLSPGRSPGRSPSSRSSGGGGRSPGKAPQLHQRLSSPSRRRNTTDTVLKNHQERLAKAQVMRDKIQEEKANKLKKIKIKEEQVKDLQEQQEKERVARAATHAEKLARAEALRDKKIAEVKRKAQEEDQKVNEIAFINSLEAQNRKMELLSKEQLAEAKRVEIQVRQQEERKRRSEELQAKEDAVLERKLAIEADRLARIAHIEDKIKESQAKVDSNKLEMETAAKEAAKDRALERELTRELVRQDRNPVIEIKSKHKGRQQQQSNQKLKEMQQKAAMLCQNFSPEYMPTHTLYDPPKWCSKCNIKIMSEALLMAHMIKRHQKSCPDEAVVESQYIIDYSDELCPLDLDLVNRQKLLRKRSKKVRTRVMTKLSELPAAKLLEPLQECPNKNRLFKCIKAMKNPKTREKGLVDLSRTVLTKIDVHHLIDKGVVDQLCDMVSGQQMLGSISKVLLQCSTFSSTASQICVRSLPQIIDCLQPGSGLLSSAMHADLLKLTATLTRSLEPCESLASDVVSYIVSKEIIDGIQTMCANTYQIKDDCAVLVNSLDLLSACCITMTTPLAPISIAPWKNDPAQLIDTLVFTKACNIVSLLYGVLLYEGPRRAAPSLSPATESVVTQCLTTLLDIARFSLHTLQSVLDSEGMSLELRHVVSYVLSSTPQSGHTLILDLCIQLIGFVVFCHPSNQKLLQNGPSPSILQLLSSLPFSYFSDMRGMILLFPTLVSACHNCPSNLAILQEKVNKVMLISYLKDQLKDSKEKHINLYPRTVFQQALKFLETPDAEVT